MKIKNLWILALMIVFVGTSHAQCLKFSDSPLEEEGLDAYSIYMQAIKSKDWELALEQWKISYDIAPAADGRRDHNFSKGIDILTHYFKEEKDKAKKEDYRKRIYELYDEMAACYAANGISIKGCNDDQCRAVKVGNVMGEKGYNMFYYLAAPYAKNIIVFDEAVEKAGLESSYIVFIPYSTIAVYQFEKGKITAEKARSIHQKLIEIAEHNINMKHKYAQYYSDGLKHVNASFAKIEGQIYDCDYFINKLRIIHDEDPDNYDKIKVAIAKLKKQDCPETDSFYIMLDEKWKAYATKENAKIQADFEIKNPGVAAKRLYEEGKYSEAIVKYRLAMEQDPDADKKANYLFSIASIQFRKLKQYSTARATALKAASLKKGWGRPYMLIGDMYASSARHCGDSWNQRLAILAAIDKYVYAKSIDPKQTAEANKKIGRYQSSKPTKEEGFMRKVKEGQKVKSGCWIGETVKVRYK